MAVPFALSKDGIESQWAVNHFSHFLLANRLFPLLLKAPAPHVACTSSMAHKMSPRDTLGEFYETDLKKITTQRLTTGTNTNGTPRQSQPT